MARRRSAPSLEVPNLEPMSLEDRARELLDAILLAAETSQIRGDNDHTQALLTTGFYRRLDLAALAPLPLMAMRSEAGMAYALAVSLASTVLTAVDENGGSLTDAAQALVNGAEP
jgi:hypothetical protein